MFNFNTFKVGEALLQSGETLMYFKLWQVVFRTGAAFLYGKVGQIILKSRTVITKWGNYYKVG